MTGMATFPNLIFAVVGGGFVEELEIGVGEDGEDDGELREAKSYRWSRRYK